MICNENNFLEWFQQRTEEEHNLANKVFEFGDYFSDMLFRNDLTKNLVSIQVKPDEESDWLDSYMTLPYELEYFDYCWFTYKIEELDDCIGRFDTDKQRLTVTSNYSDSVVLHEMIHLHEFVLNELPLFYHDAVLWSLYRDLLDKIPDIDEKIKEICHIYKSNQIYEQGGLHDILFLLKSFDLDLRMGYELGTVFGYGMIDEINQN